MSEIGGLANFANAYWEQSVVAHVISPRCKLGAQQTVIKLADFPCEDGVVRSKEKEGYGKEKCLVEVLPILLSEAFDDLSGLPLQYFAVSISLCSKDELPWQYFDSSRQF